jgi:hypothetical protein
MFAHGLNPASPTEEIAMAKETDQVNEGEGNKTAVRSYNRA